MLEVDTSWGSEQCLANVQKLSLLINQWEHGFRISTNENLALVFQLMSARLHIYEK